MSQLEQYHIKCTTCGISELLKKLPSEVWTCNNCEERKRNPNHLRVKRKSTCGIHNYTSIGDSGCKLCFEEKIAKKIQFVKPLAEAEVKRTKGMNLDAVRLNQKRVEKKERALALEQATLDTPILLNQVLTALNELNKKLGEKN